MTKARSIRTAAANAAAITTATLATALATTLLVGCSDDRDAQARAAERGGIALAAPTPAPPPIDTTPVTTEPVKRAYENVTYGEAESVFRRGRYPEAAEMLAVFVEGQPSSMQGHYLLGLSAWKSGDHETAETALVRAVALNGESVKARTNLARVLLERGRPADALPHLETALDIDPSAHEVWRVLGNTYSQLGRSADAIEAYREALMLKDDDAWTMNNYGLVLIRSGRFGEAVLPLSRAVQLSPGTALFRNNLGIALERTGEPGGAMMQYSAAIEADSTFTKARVNLERVREVIGNREVEGFDIDAAAALFVIELERWPGEEEHDC